MAAENDVDQICIYYTCELYCSDYNSRFPPLLKVYSVAAENVLEFSDWYIYMLEHLVASDEHWTLFSRREQAACVTSQTSHH